MEEGTSLQLQHLSAQYDILGIGRTTLTKNSGKHVCSLSPTMSSSSNQKTYFGCPWQVASCALICDAFNHGFSRERRLIFDDQLLETLARIHYVVASQFVFGTSVWHILRARAGQQRAEKTELDVEAHHHHDLPIRFQKISQCRELCLYYMCLLQRRPRTLMDAIFLYSSLPI
jgi:hypothetical protein